MSNAQSRVSLSLLGLVSDGQVASDLLERSGAALAETKKAPTTDTLINDEAVSRISKLSFHHARYLASSKGTSSAALAALARVNQKITKRCVAKNPNADEATVQYLYDWMLENRESSGLDDIVKFQNPAAWWPRYFASQMAYDADQTLEGVVAKANNALTAYSLQAPLTVLATYADSLHEIVGLPQDSQIVKTLRECIGLYLAAVPENRPGMRKAFSERYNVYVGGISDDLCRAKLVAATLQNKSSSVRIDDELIVNMVRYPQVCEMETGNPHRTSNVELSPNTVDFLLAHDSQWSNETVCASASYSELWSDEQLNTAVRQSPSATVRQNSFEDFHSRLSVETFESIVLNADGNGWGFISTSYALKDPAMLSRFASMVPQAALTLALVLPPRSLAEFLRTSDTPPSFSPQSYLDAVSGEVRFVGSYRSEHKDRPVSIAEQHRYSPLSHGETRPRFASLHALFSESRDLGDGSPVSAWILDLLSRASDVTIQRVGMERENLGHQDAFVFALHYWFDKYLQGYPAAWMIALDLLPDWSGSLEELACAAADSARYQTAVTP
jgi:hypothetical protein